MCVCRTHSPQLAGYPTRILQHQQQDVGTRKTLRKREVQFQLFPLAVYVVCCCVPAEHRQLSFDVVAAMHGTTAAVLQVILVTATNCVVSVYMRVCVSCWRAILDATWTIHPTLPLNFKTTRVVQQRYSSSSSSSGTTAANLT